MKNSNLATSSLLDVATATKLVKTFDYDVDVEESLDLSSDYQKLAVGILKVLVNGQRLPITAHVKDIHANLNEQWIGTIQVFNTPSGRVIVDGQHRALAILKECEERKMDPMRVLVQCQVTDGTDKEAQEAFIRLNKTRRIKPVADFLVNCELGNSDYLAMKKMVEGCGAVISQGKVPKSHIIQVTSLKQSCGVDKTAQTYINGQFTHTRKALTAMMKAWPNQEISGTTLRALTDFSRAWEPRFKNKKTLTAEHLATFLRSLEVEKTIKSKARREPNKKVTVTGEDFGVIKLKMAKRGGASGEVGPLGQMVMLSEEYNCYEGQLIGLPEKHIKLMRETNKAMVYDAHSPTLITSKYK